MRTLLASIVILGLGVPNAAAQTVDVATESELRGAILVVHPGGAINFQADITLTADLPAIQQDLTIEGNGHTLSGGGAFRGFFVYTGTVTIRNLTIQNASARGGDGGNGDDSVVGAGGGGGAGLGGALFVAAGANVTIEHVRLLTNEGRGGNGGRLDNGVQVGGGGGGGLGGHGSSLGGGGGGIGVGADGGRADFGTNPGGNGIVIGAAGGGRGTDDSVGPGAGGGADGGGGGGGRASGGGGIAGGDGVHLQAGAGGFGGGGGGAIDGSGGAGGFGGGGGGVAWSGGAGTGGFGGGGGGGRVGWTASGSGGFGGGAGGGGADSHEAGVGGGGAGMGGAIFVMEGGSLTVIGTLTINGNTVAPGAASGAAAGGSAFGSGLFLHGDGHLLFEPAAGELQAIDDEISDMTGSGGTAPDVGSWMILKTGAGTLQLAGTNRFTGGVFVFDGALRLAPGPSPIGSGRLTLHGGVVRPAGLTDFTNPITLGTLGAGGGVFDLTDVNWPVVGNIMGQGGLTVVGGHILLLTANNFHTGGTTVRGGSTVLITSDRNLGAATGRLTLNGGTLWTQGSIGSSRAITIGELGGTFNTDSFSVIFDGAFDGPGALIKRGTSTLSLYGISTRTGSLHVAEGRLRIGHETLLWPTAPVAVDAAGVLDILGGVRPTIGSLSGLGTVALGNAATLTIGADGASTMFAGAIGGTGSIAKIGAGTLSLIGVSSYSGGTTINSGAIAIAADAALGDVSGALNLGGGRLSALGAFVSTRPVVLSAAGGVIDTGGGSGGNHGWPIGLSGPVTGPGSLRTIGSGIVTLAHAGNSYTGGTMVTGGTLRLGASDVIPDQGTLTVAAGATFDLAGQDETIGALDGGGTIQLASALRVSVDVPAAFTGTIAGNGDFFKSGAGTLTLSGISPFTGMTTIESGTMNVTGSLASSAFVMTGGTLAGAGTIGALTMSGGTLAATGTIGALTMNGGALAPGGSELARLTVNGDAALNAGAFVIIVNGATPGINYDQLVVNGGVALQGATLQVVVDVTPALDTPLVILDNDGADPIAGTFTGLPEGAILTIGGVRLRISYAGGSGNDVVLLRDRPEVETLTWYLAEGATGVFFDFDLLLANPTNAPVPVAIEFLTESGATIAQTHTLPATSRTTMRVDEIPGLEAAAVSTLVTSTTGVPIVVERTMRWDASGYGAHTEKATAGAAPAWYFAEGSQGFFSTYFLLVNPHDSANTAHVTWLRQGEPALERDYPLGPHARVTIDAGLDPELIDRAFGAKIEFDQPATAERAMYFGSDPLFSGGHEAAGATAPSTHWFLAEGATGSYFTTYVLLANPNDMEAAVTLTYLPASGIPVIRTHSIPPQQRVTINVALEDASLASAAVATRVESPLPLVVERAQYWPNPAWIEAHNSIGVTETATTWGLAEGRVGGPNSYQTYILLANSEAQAAVVTLTFLRANGTTLVKTFTVPPTSRFNVGVTGPGGEVPELADESFGTLIESTQPIVVERSMYANANGVTWAAGTNATATRLP